MYTHACTRTLLLYFTHCSSPTVGRGCVFVICNLKLRAHGKVFERFHLCLHAKTDWHKHQLPPDLLGKSVHCSSYPEFAFFKRFSNNQIRPKSA